MKNPGNPAIELKAIVVRPVERKKEKKQAMEFLDSYHYLVVNKGRDEIRKLLSSPLGAESADFSSAMNARHRRCAFRSLFAAHPSFSLAF